MPRINAQTFQDLVHGRRTGLGAALLRAACSAAEVPYRLAVAARNRYYDRSSTAVRHAGVPVISVGNLTVGGTGKTPMVAWLAKWARRQDLRVAILSRGYGAEAGGVNDEALELERQLPDVPHLQNPDRVESARIAVEELESQLLILDDGFQHRRLYRDFDIVLVDASQPVGFTRLLPRGLYREPPRGLRRAHAVVLTRCDMVAPAQIDWFRDFALRHHPQLMVLEASHRPQAWLAASGDRRGLDQLDGCRVAAFCGIGHPDAFWHSLAAAGCEVVQHRVFPDHHPYHRDDVRDLDAWVRGLAEVEAVVCTGKDLVKIGLDTLGGKPLWALSVQMELTEPGDLQSALRAITTS